MHGDAKIHHALIWYTISRAVPPLLSIAALKATANLTMCADMVRPIPAE